jgi:hypothetical protein
MLRLASKQWAIARGLVEYAVINACRVLRCERDGGLYSKWRAGGGRPRTASAIQP